MKSAIVLLLLFASACSKIEPSVDLLHNFESGDQQIEARLVRLNFHATSPHSYRIYVVKKGEQIDPGAGLEVLNTDSKEGLIVQWMDDQNLKVSCLKGTVYHWQNKVLVDDKTIRIELDSRCQS